MDEKFRHAAMISTRGQGGKNEEVVTGVDSFKESMKVNDPRLLDIVPEPWWGGPTAVMTTIFPSVIIQQQVNSVSTRHIQPSGHGSFDFVWTHFGFEDDTPEMHERRLIQANLFGDLSRPWLGCSPLSKRDVLTTVCLVYVRWLESPRVDM